MRRHRKEKKMTLRTVAEKTGVSEGFLSQVENNVKSPSVDTLMSICGAIGVNPGELMTQLQGRRNMVVIRKNEWSDVEFSHTGFATLRFRSPEERMVVDSAVLFLQPGAKIPVRKNIKNGQEVLCILKGSLTLEQADESVLLREGDSVHFWAVSDGQRVSNVGDEEAVAVWVGTL